MYNGSGARDGRCADGRFLGHAGNLYTGTQTRVRSEFSTPVFTVHGHLSAPSTIPKAGPDRRLLRENPGMMTSSYETLNVVHDGRLVRMEMARPRRLDAVAMTGERELVDAARRSEPAMVARHPAAAEGTSGPSARRGDVNPRRFASSVRTGNQTLAGSSVEDAASLETDPQLNAHCGGTGVRFPVPRAVRIADQHGVIGIHLEQEAVREPVLDARGESG